MTKPQYPTTTTEPQTAAARGKGILGDSDGNLQSVPGLGCYSNSRRCRYCIIVNLLSGTLSAFAIWQVGKILPLLAQAAATSGWDSKMALVIGLAAMVGTAAPLSLKSFVDLAKGIKR